MGASNAAKVVAKPMKNRSFPDFDSGGKRAAIPRRNVETTIRFLITVLEIQAHKKVYWSMWLAATDRAHQAN